MSARHLAAWLLVGGACAGLPGLSGAAEAGAPPPAALLAAGMSARKAVASARSALAEGRYAEALAFYERVLALETGTDARRGEALLGSAIVLVMPSPLREPVLGRARLQEFLAAYPRDARRAEAEALAGALDEIAAARAGQEQLATSTAGKVSACTDEKETIVARLAAAEAEAQTLRSEAQAQHAEIASLRGELQTLKSEIEKRDEALRKVKEALVGSRPSR